MTAAVADALVLAFDADCHRCRAVAAAVARRCPELEVLPLRDYRVAAWRREALGDDPPWAPTLLAVDADPDGDRVRAWCGPRLVPALVAALGPVRAARVGAAVLGAARAAGFRRPSPGRDA